ncbi:hypothetical protein [Agrobacterium rosae]|uniref:hypothetical protein n=1 Tax=Agrobacterium rosae TaxID=1972867 RepID=UPI001AECE0AE|nr:hypothetical protein [Agrobacterium rosae]
METMNTQESMHRFGLPPSKESLSFIRAILQAEADKEAQGKGHEREDDLALLCCVQLFTIAQPDDILRIWRAKSAGFDLHCAIDVQLLCGAGLEKTKSYLRQSADPVARDALSYIEECEITGDFNEFSPSQLADEYHEYFRIA